MENKCQDFSLETQKKKYEIQKGSREFVLFLMSGQHNNARFTITAWTKKIIIINTSEYMSKLEFL